MLLFALLVFSLFIQLTIASTKNEINLLVTIGASPTQLQRFLMKQFLPANTVITLACLLVIAILQYVLQAFLSKQNMYVSSWIDWYTVVAAALILVVLWLVNYTTIKKYIKETEK
jgi:cell division protein FtsX